MTDLEWSKAYSDARQDILPNKFILFVSRKRKERTTKIFLSRISPFCLCGASSPAYSTINLTPAADADLASLSRFVCQFSINMVELNGDPNPKLVIKFMRKINDISNLAITQCTYGPELFDQLKSVPFIHIYLLGIVNCQPKSTMTSYALLDS